MGLLLDFDTAVSAGLHAHTGTPFERASEAITLLGGTEVAAIVTLVAVLVLLALRDARAALSVALAVGLTQIVVFAAKQAVERPRPPANDSLTQATGFSFPSGHSATSAALFGILLLILMPRLTGGARLAVGAIGVTLIVTVGATRVALGAHYPSDVLVGWLVGLTLAVAAAARTAKPGGGRPRALAGPHSGYGRAPSEF